MNVWIDILHLLFCLCPADAVGVPQLWTLSVLTSSSPSSSTLTPSPYITPVARENPPILSWEHTARVGRKNNGALNVLDEILLVAGVPDSGPSTAFAQFPSRCEFAVVSESPSAVTFVRYSASNGGTFFNDLGVSAETRALCTNIGIMCLRVSIAPRAWGTGPLTLEITYRYTSAVLNQEYTSAKGVLPTYETNYRVSFITPGQ